MTTLREIVAKPLRGKHNSVRYRFFILPAETLRYKWSRLRGRSWIQYYADYMERSVEQSAEKPISREYIDAGAEHLTLLKGEGLKPGQRVLDLGCGVLRTGAHVIPYVGAGRYVGTEISPGRIARGQKLVLEPLGIRACDYRVIVVTDNKLKELQGEEPFDFIFANSVLTHMPIEDVRVLLGQMARLLTPTGAFIYTYTVGNDMTQNKMKDFSYPEQLMKDECARAGLNYEVLNYRHLIDFQYPETRLIKATRL